MQTSAAPHYRRVLLKLSGEALSAGQEGILDHAFIGRVAEVLKKCLKDGVQVGVIVGAGNIWRGRQGKDMDPVTADHMGMLATAINALALADALEQLDCDVRVQTAIAMNQVAEPYIRNRAMRHLEKGRVVIFGCGTGNPFFTTDTAAALRALEIDADIMFKATNVDGVYDKDPHKFEDAKKYDTLSFDEILSHDLKVMDGTAASLCRDNSIPILVFNLDDPQNIVKAIKGENVGTVVK